MLTYLYVQPRRVASKPTRNGYVHPLTRTQMPTEGTGSSTLSEDKPMAQVTYRGVKYDTDSRKSHTPIKSELTYRGVKHSKVDEVLPSYLDVA